MFYFWETIKNIDRLNLEGWFYDTCFIDKSLTSILHNFYTIM